MDFAFLIHSRDWRDVQRKFKVAKFLPKSWVEFWCFHWPPVVVSKITGLKSQIDGKGIKGWLIGIPMTAKQMLENRSLAQKRVVQAINKAEKLGAKIVGLGALTSVITNGGQSLLSNVRVKITTGNALTAAVTIAHIKEIVNKFKLEKSRLIIAVVGATGSIGQAVSQVLIKEKVCKKILLFGHTLENLRSLENKIADLNSNNNIEVEAVLDGIERIIEADLIVVATSAIGAIIKSEYLKKDAIVYDITQPQNVSSETRRERSDLKIFDGGLAQIKKFTKRLPLGLPRGVIFSCLGETITLALENINEDFSIGHFAPEKIEQIQRLAQKNNIIPSNLWE